MLDQASSTSDYDFSLALDQALTFLISEQGKGIRESLADGMVKFINEVVFGAIDYGGLAIRDSLAELIGGQPSTGTFTQPLQFADNLNSLIQTVSREGLTTPILNFLVSISDSMARYSSEAKTSLLTLDDNIEELKAEADALESTSRMIMLIVKSARTVQADGNGSEASEKFNRLIRRALREPVSQALIAQIVSNLTERIAEQAVQRLFQPSITRLFRAPIRV